MATDTGNERGGDLESLHSASHLDAVTRFNEFYDFAFPRVYRFAQRRMRDEAQAQALCRLVLTRALTTLGGLEVFEYRVRRDADDFAYWLYCLTRRTAEQLSSQLAEHPELLATTDLEGDLEGDFEDQTLEILRASRIPSSP